MSIKDENAVTKKKDKRKMFCIILSLLLVFTLSVTANFAIGNNKLKELNEKDKKQITQLEKENKDLKNENKKLKETNEELKVTIEKLEDELNGWEVIKDVKLTAYCPCTECSGQWGTQTASGATTTEGRTIAVDRNVIPLGSEVMINGHTYIAEDVGGGVKGNHIDIFMNDHNEAVEFGVKKVDVKVKKNIKG